eukprot:97353_1
MASNRFGDVLELISFGATFKAQEVLIGVMNDEVEVYVESKSNKEQIAKICLDRLNQKNTLNETMFLAAKKGNTKLVTYLLQKTDVKVDIQDHEKLTPLFYAAALNHKHVVTTLLQDYHAKCSVSDDVDEKESTIAKNALQYKLKKTVFPCEENDNLEIIKLLVVYGNFDIDSNLYDQAKEAGHPQSVLQYLNEAGKLDLNGPESKSPKDKESEPKIKKVKFHENNDRPILNFTFFVCLVLFVIGLAFGSDVAAFRVASKNDCNASLMNGSEYVSFGVNDFILGGSITHLVLYLLTFGVIVWFDREDAAREYKMDVDRENAVKVSITVVYSIVCCFVISWTIIGFVLH